jgi:hypothetical protein
MKGGSAIMPKSDLATNATIAVNLALTGNVLMRIEFQTWNPESQSWQALRNSAKIIQLKSAPQFYELRNAVQNFIWRWVFEQHQAATQAQP